MKTGILAVSFGTTYRDTREKNIEALVAAVRASYPDCQVYQAYSSGLIRKAVLAREGLAIFGVAEALLRMKEDGVKRVVLMPTHIIDGIENHRMKQAAREHRGDFARMEISDVLLASEADYGKTALALWEGVREEAGRDPVIFMGHGTAHPADESYAKLERELNRLTDNGVYIATVEGAVTISDVAARLGSDGRLCGRILLAPLMLVAGDHARNDMAGEKHSFASKLRALGCRPDCLLRGIGEYEGIRAVYLEHLGRAMERIRR